MAQAALGPRGMDGCRRRTERHAKPPLTTGATGTGAGPHGARGNSNGGLLALAGRAAPIQVPLQTPETQVAWAVAWAMAWAWVGMVMVVVVVMVWWWW